MLTDGVLMRLNKQDFRELMNEPLLQWVDYASRRATSSTRGGRWLDVRLPSEHQNLAIEGSLNIPLYFIRLKLSTLDRDTPYVVYCDTGRRSSAAAYHPGRARLRCLRAARGAQWRCQRHAGCPGRGEEARGQAAGRKIK